MKIVAIGGGNYSLDDENRPYNVDEINKEIVRLSGKKHPRLLNIGFNAHSDYYYSFIKKIFALMRKISAKFDKIVTKMENKAFSKRDVIDKYGPWGLYLFVAIPLPGTGAWTGSLIAAMLDIPLKKAFPAVALGVITAGIIVAFVSYGAAALIF